jgi:hypothetical protein
MNVDLYVKIKGSEKIIFKKYLHEIMDEIMHEMMYKV